MSCVPTLFLLNGAKPVFSENSFWAALGPSTGDIVFCEGRVAGGIADGRRRQERPAPLHAAVLVPMCKPLHLMYRGLHGRAHGLGDQGAVSGRSASASAGPSRATVWRVHLVTFSRRVIRLLVM